MKGFPQIIAQLNLDWDDGDYVETTRGPRIVYTAPATNEFWTVWKIHKEYLRENCITCYKSDYLQSWIVNFWDDSPETEIKEQITTYRTSFDILNITPETEYQDARKKYLILAKQHHPDKEGGNTETFQEIQRAWVVVKEHLEQRRR